MPRWMRYSAFEDSMIGDIFEKIGVAFIVNTIRDDKIAFEQSPAGFGNVRLILVSLSLHFGPI